MSTYNLDLIKVMRRVNRKVGLQENAHSKKLAAKVLKTEKAKQAIKKAEDQLLIELSEILVDLMLEAATEVTEAN